MWKALHALDRVLRGESTRPDRLRDGALDLPLPGIAMLLLVLAAFYGFCMGWFTLLNRDSPALLQLLASAIKVPALFLLSLLVTFPSLYVFNALVGSRLGALALLRLLVASLGVTLAVLASFGPIVAFFSVTTTNYSFMVLLNVVFFSVAGVLGLGFLLQTLQRLSRAAEPEPLAVDDDARPADIPAKPAGALDRLPGGNLGDVKIVFLCWVVVYGLVGAQMSWVLRPFIGSPDRPFEWFRPRQSNFFEAVARLVADLFS
jgi:hypothetical protein